MRWTLICTLLLVAVYVLLYRTTLDVWTATNGAGIVAVIFLTGAAICFTRLFERRWQKIAVAALSVLMIAGLVAHWIIMWRMTEWQYGRLQSIRRVIYNGMVMSTLKDPAYEAFREFRTSQSGATLGDVFLRLNPGGVPPVDSVITADTGPLYTSISDSLVEMTSVARFVPGFDSSFVNHDGRHGLAQIQIRLTPKGASYDIQN